MQDYIAHQAFSIVRDLKLDLVDAAFALHELNDLIEDANITSVRNRNHS